MSRTSKIDRARRNTLKAGSLVLGAALAASFLPKVALATPGNNGNGNGGCGVGQQTNGCGGNSGGSCFARGTLIRTREGYRPIETLAAGNEVAVRFQGFAPIKAVVSHTLNSVSGRWDGNQSNLPVLVRRGALGENSPDADLCLTALHAVYVDGCLMPAGDLVNGTSIIFEAAGGRDRLDFFNIELDRHDVLDVQSASCESMYRAATDRCAPLLHFTGRRSKLQSHMRSVASIVVDWRQPIDIIRDKLEERAIDFTRAA
jgi:Hint domain